MPIEKFELPEEFDQFNVSTDVRISNSILFTCRLPDSRDSAWITSDAEKKKSTGKTYEINFVINAFACTLIRLNEKKLSHYVKNDYRDIKDLLDATAINLNDEDLIKAALFKRRAIIEIIPYPMLKFAYTKKFAPWQNKKNMEANAFNIFNTDDL